MNQQQRRKQATLSFLKKLASAKVAHGAENAAEYVAGYEAQKARSKTSWKFSLLVSIQASSEMLLLLKGVTPYRVIWNRLNDPGHTIRAM